MKTIIGVTLISFTVMLISGYVLLTSLNEQTAEQKNWNKQEKIIKLTGELFIKSLLANDYESVKDYIYWGDDKNEDERKESFSTASQLLLMCFTDTDGVRVTSKYNEDLGVDALHWEAIKDKISIEEIYEVEFTADFQKSRFKVKLGSIQGDNKYSFVLQNIICIKKDNAIWKIIYDNAFIAITEAFTGLY